jgi:hypothetical protein
VEQTVVLNTPGKPDGVFSLIVNNNTVVHREDLYYRDARSNGAISTGDGVEGILDDPLGQLLNNGLPLSDSPVGDKLPEILDTHSYEVLFSVLVSSKNISLHRASTLLSPTLPPVTDDSLNSSVNLGSLYAETTPQDPIGFSGIFFR